MRSLLAPSAFALAASLWACEAILGVDFDDARPRAPTVDGGDATSPTSDADAEHDDGGDALLRDGAADGDAGDSATTARVVRCGTSGEVCICQGFAVEDLERADASGWTGTSCAAPDDGACCVADGFPGDGSCKCGPFRCTSGGFTCTCQLTDGTSYPATSCGDSTPCCTLTSPDFPKAIYGAACYCGNACALDAGPKRPSCDLASYSCGAGFRRARTCAE